MEPKEPGNGGGNSWQADRRTQTKWRRGENDKVDKLEQLMTAEEKQRDIERLTGLLNEALAAAGSQTRLETVPRWGGWDIRIKGAQGYLASWSDVAESWSQAYGLLLGMGLALQLAHGDDLLADCVLVDTIVFGEPTQ